MLDIRARIGELAPGYGGIYVSGTKTVIILNDWSQIERAIAAVAAFYGADRITETVRIEQGGYAISQLSAWYQTAQSIVWPLGGVGSSGIDEVAGRIEFDVVTQKTADTAREALKDTGIPEEAIYFQVRQPALLSDFTTKLRSPLGIEIELHAPTSVVMDEAVEFTILLTNNGKHVVDLSYLAISRSNFILFADGVEVWSKNGRSSGIETSRGERSILKPGEALRFATEWSVIDNDLEPIQPGEYTIIAQASGSEDSNGLGVSYLLVSEPQPITLLAE